MRNWLLCILSLTVCTHVIIAGEKIEDSTPKKEHVVFFNNQQPSHKDSFNPNTTYPQDIQKEDAHQNRLVSTMATIAEEE